MCELNFLPLRPGALEEEDMAEFLEEGIINADGKARRRLLTFFIFRFPPPLFFCLIRYPLHNFRQFFKAENPNGGIPMPVVLIDTTPLAELQAGHKQKQYVIVGFLSRL